MWSKDGGTRNGDLDLLFLAAAALPEKNRQDARRAPRTMRVARLKEAPGVMIDSTITRPAWGLLIELELEMKWFKMKTIWRSLVA